MSEKEAAKLAKEKYPLTAKEKRCIEAFGQMVLNRAKYKRELLAGDMGKREQHHTHKFVVTDN